MKTIIDFIWDADSPKVKAPCANLMRAISRSGISASWSEWRIEDGHGPGHRLGEPDANLSSNVNRTLPNCCSGSLSQHSGNT